MIGDISQGVFGFGFDHVDLKGNIPTFSISTWVPKIKAMKQ